MKIKAFTFAELMISLTVIAIITAILYPTISELAPNNNKELFKSAYKTIELTVSEMMNSNNPPQITSSAKTCCTAFATYMNTLDENCSEKQELTTSNGMRWYFQIENSKCRVWIDVNASNNNKSTTNSQISNDAAANSKPTVTSGFFFTGDTTSQDAFYADIDENGKITIEDEVALNHLKDDSN